MDDFNNKGNNKEKNSPQRRVGGRPDQGGKPVQRPATGNTQSSNVGNKSANQRPASQQNAKSAGNNLSSNGETRPVKQRPAAQQNVNPAGRSKPSVGNAPELFDKKSSTRSASGQPDNEQSPKDDKKPAAKTKKVKKRKIRKEHKVARRIGIVFCSLILIGMLTVSSVGLYVFKNMMDFVTGDVAIDLDAEKANQSQTTIIYSVDDNGNEVELARLHGEENRIWVDLDEIPKDLQNAYIALEDQRFKVHSGVDWRRVVSSAFLHHFTQGGSTITQQLIKNLTGENGRTFIRKFTEIERALNLEKHYSKETILEAYLNTLYLDGGCYGVQTASEYYFGKNVSDLNLAECACIAAITNAPRKYDPIVNPENNRDRRNLCLSDMLTQGFITQSEYDEAKNYDLIFTTDENYVPPEDTTSEDSDSMIPVDENNVGENPEEEEVQSYYIDYIIDKVIDDLQQAYGYSLSEAWRKVYYGGLKIQAAVDIDIQQQLEDIYYNRKGFPTATNSFGEQVQSSMVIMDYTGRVVALVGQAGEKQGARCLNIATGAKRQPGSSIKPLSVYSLALDSGQYFWSTYVQNYGILINGERWPQNYGGDMGSPTSYETIQQALAPSHNTVPAQLIDKLGTDTSFNWLKDTFKMTSLKTDDDNYAPLAVGAMSEGVYGIEMCAAYTTFGTGGIYYEPYCYYNVTNSAGSTVYLTHNDQGEQVMKQGTADVMNKLLQTVVTSSNGTGRNYAVSGFDMFAKTGTTTDEKDRWFIGGTPYYVCTVWMGYAEHAEELDFSSNYCGLLYQTVMNNIHKNLPEKSFEYGDELVQRRYCTTTGLLAGSSCSTAVGWFSTDSLPSTCTSHRGYVSDSTTAAATTEAADATTAAPTTAATTAATTTPVVADGE